MTELSMELTMLLWASVLYVAQIAVAAVAADVQNGVAWGLGNRDVIPVVPGWGGRAKRAHANMAEQKSVSQPYTEPLLSGHMHASAGVSVE